ncbi:sugar phosphate isomerase/epimerase family protein [Sphingobacterium sp. MYb382]|uniref:sugar phosphate isomerase/epimerase family protein n=1 Tax=Sphingobacterium sp. MYb382 TaxID=2745278 RepID=UPI0030A7F58F
MLQIVFVAMLVFTAFSQVKAQKTKDVGLQLYSLREILPGNVASVLKDVAAAGYTQVELYGFNSKDQFWGLDATALKALLAESKLNAVSGHFNMTPYFKNGDETELHAAIAAAKTLGLKYVTIPWLDADVRTSGQDYYEVAKKLNRAGLLCKQAGLKLAYHNHDFEFIKYDGKTGLDILLQNTNKKLVDFEMDMYWVIKSGVKPEDLFKQNRGRFTLWHIKDVDKSNPNLNTEIGSGSLDYKSIFRAKKISGMKYFFVEHENNYTPDHIGSITKSSAYVKENLL